MNGILLVDKPAGWTSNDVVQKLRGALHEKRIGHAGTLDPMATGLLTVFVGRATRAVQFAESDEKTYIAGLRLGLTTDTQDITGSILPVVSAPETSGVPLRSLEADDPAVCISRSQLEAALAPFCGRIQQIPPMYSALHVNGQRLYDLARQGKTVERQPREITVHELRILEGKGADWTLLVRCSKGTYVRTLCHDIGQQLGCGGCMFSLRRICAGCFSVDDAVKLEDAVALAAEGKAESLLIPVDRLFAAYPELTVSAAGEKKLRNGNPVPLSAIHGLKRTESAWMPSDDLTDRGICRVYSETRQFLALARFSDESLKTVKSFYEV